MQRWAGKVAVVTGSSSGIGLNVVKTLTEHGLQVVGLARNIESIEELSKSLTNASGKLFAKKCDVCEIEEVRETFEWIKNNLGPVHVLVNNAGVLQKTFFSDGDPMVWKKVLDTNLFGLSLCCHEAIKQMREHDIAGHIININSIAGHKVVTLDPPEFNMYGPSKYGVTALTEILRQELNHFKTNIKVTSISPGLVHDTNIFKSGNMEIFNPSVVAEAPHLLPEDVTNAILYVLGTPPHVQVHELMIKPIGEPF